MLYKCQQKSTFNLIPCRKLVDIQSSSLADLDCLVTWLQSVDELKFSNQTSSAITAFVSLFLCHDHCACVILYTLNRPCPKLGSRQTEIEGLGSSKLRPHLHKQVRRNSQEILNYIIYNCQNREFKLCFQQYPSEQVKYKLNTVT